MTENLVEGRHNAGELADAVYILILAEAIS